jgi:hypothetical protein
LLIEANACSGNQQPSLTEPLFIIEVILLKDCCGFFRPLSKRMLALSRIGVSFFETTDVSNLFLRIIY